MREFPNLWSIDSNGALRYWRMEVDGNAYRSVSGVEGGKAVVSKWKYASAKNEGRSNATTPEEQAVLIVESHYRTRQEQGYHADKSKAGNGVAHFAPMLANKYGDALKRGLLKFPAYVQPKFDGIRCIANVNGLWTRRGKPILGAPHVWEALQSFFAEFPDAVLDGELYNHEYRDDFDSIASAVRKQKLTPEQVEKSREVVQYHVYDAPVIQFDCGAVERSADFGARFDWLLTVFPPSEDTHPVHVADTHLVASEEEVDEKFAEFLEAGYEGLMFRADAPYLNDRDWRLLKRKEFEDAEFEIVEILEGVGNWSGVAKHVKIRLEDGRTQNAGMRGTMDFARRLLSAKDEYAGGTVTIRFQNRTPDGKLRFPVAVQFWARGEERA